MLATAEASPLLIKYVALMVGLLVILAFGVRPALGRALSRTSPKSLAKGGTKELPGGSAADQTALKSPQDGQVPTDRTRSQEIFEQVTEHLKEEPTQSSRLLQSWIHSD
jgi:flagellar M-ring protein FliF